MRREEGSDKRSEARRAGRLDVKGRKESHGVTEICVNTREMS